MNQLVKIVFHRPDWSYGPIYSLRSTNLCAQLYRSITQTAAAL